MMCKMEMELLEQGGDISASLGALQQRLGPRSDWDGGKSALLLLWKVEKLLRSTHLSGHPKGG